MPFLTPELSQKTPKIMFFNKSLNIFPHFWATPYPFFWVKFQIWLCHLVCSSLKFA